MVLTRLPENSENIRYYRLNSTFVANQTLDFNSLLQGEAQFAGFVYCHVSGSCSYRISDLVCLDAKL